MTLSLRKAGLAAGAAVLLSAAGASGAMAADTTVSLTSSILVITAGSGTSNGISVANDGTNTYRVKEASSSINLVAGTGNLQWDAISNHEWRVTAPGTTITGVSVNAGDQLDAVNLSALTLPSTIQGGDGNDILTGGSGTSGTTTVNGDGGNDTIHASAVNTTENGGAGTDTLYGGAGEDHLNGGDDNDTIHADDSSLDYIDGGNGSDTAYVDATEYSWTNVEFIV